MTKKEFRDIVWQKRKDAHQVHHHIADFILHDDDREHPPALRRMVENYRAMMAEADEMTS